MKFYFYSPFPCVLACEGRVLTNLSANVKCVSAPANTLFDIYIDDCYPAAVSAQNVLTNATSFNFYGGKLFIPKRRLLPLPYKKICSKTIVAGGEQYIANLYNDVLPRITLLSFNDQTTVTLPFVAQSIDLYSTDEYLVIAAGSTVKRLCFLRRADLSEISSFNCAQFGFDKTLAIKRYFVGAGSYICTEHYSVTDGFSLLGKSAVVLRRENLSPLCRAMAFIERVKVGADIKEYLDESIFDKADVISSFLGEFDYILPPCDERNPYTFALVGKKGVRYVEQTVNGGKVCDVDVTPYPKNA